ncbi:MAG: hypothetical protein ACFFAU_17260 [Candidatus Hodarchaeota archaeon]
MEGLATNILEEAFAEFLGGLFLVLLLGTLGFLRAYINKRRLKKYFKIFWKRSSVIKPSDILGFRGNPQQGFKTYYHHIPEVDEFFKKRIDEDKNILILGNPLSGKSRLIYQNLISLKRNYDVIIPNVMDIELNEFKIPSHWFIWRKRIVIFDDLNKFVESKNFSYLLQQFLEKKIIIIASCRFGREFDKFSKVLEREKSIFHPFVEIPNIDRKVAEFVAKKVGIDLSTTEFDGKNIGSIFLPIDTMRERFKECTEYERITLRSITQLYKAGLYKGRENFSLEHLKKVSKEINEVELKAYEWDRIFRNLKKNGFIEIINNDIVIEEVYLNLVITNQVNLKENFSQMVEIFSNNPDALTLIGNRAYQVSIKSPVVQILEFISIAISSYQTALDFIANPTENAMVHYRLGHAYLMLANVGENIKVNCTDAIEAFKKAFNTFTSEHYPIEYGKAHEALGIAFLILAETGENEVENCIYAIEAFEKAKIIFNKDRYPFEYARVQTALGDAFFLLVNRGENISENFRKAFNAYSEVVEIFKQETYPENYLNITEKLHTMVSLLLQQFSVE